MPDTQPALRVTTRPSDLSAALSLGTGTIHLQNLGPEKVAYAYRSTPVADVFGVRVAGGHVIEPGEPPRSLTVISGQALYAWAIYSETKPTIVVTIEEEATE